MANATYRVAVIGHTGRGDYGHGIDAVWQSIPNCELVTVADADPAGLAAAQKRLKVDHGFADYRRMLDDEKPDIVSVAPRWIDQHADMALACAERGIHVYMEKPFCRSLFEADRIVSACEEHRVKLAIAFQTRYSPKLAVVRQLVEDGTIGQVLELRGRGKEDRRGGGEDLWVLGSHIMNLMHYFAGQPAWCFAKVTDQGDPIQPRHVVDGPEGIGPLAGDAVRAMFGFPGDVTGYFASRRGMAGEGRGRFGLTIFGSKGKIEILTGSLPEAHLLADSTWSPGRSGKAWVAISSAGVGVAEPLKDTGAEAGNHAACLDLIDAIEQDRQPEANVYEARQTVEMISAVFASQLAGRPLPLPLTDRRPPLTIARI